MVKEDDDDDWVDGCMWGVSCISALLSILTLLYILYRRVSVENRTRRRCDTLRGEKTTEEEEEDEIKE